jgi:tRNA (guanine37-N1)-methyltransferase
VDYHGMKVPPVLLSGDHKKIGEWRHEAALELTRKQRPDLLPPEEETPPDGGKKKKK